MSNPVDTYLGMRKQSAFGQQTLPGMGRFMRSPVMDNMAQGAGQAAAGLAVTGLSMAAMKVYQALRKRSDFKGMMEANPDLQEFQMSDPSKFNAHYNSLRAINPGYSQDPFVAGSYMRQLSVNPENAGAILVAGLESRSKTGPKLQSKLGPSLSLSQNL